MDQEGFDYREIALRVQFGGGRVAVEEAVLDSLTLGLAARGSLGLEDYSVDLTVLVAPFSPIDQVVRRVPIVGYVLGGALTSIPIGVRGNIYDPQVEPLSPAAVTSELAGVFQRTFKLPGRLLAPLQEEVKPTEGAR